MRMLLAVAAVLAGVLGSPTNANLAVPDAARHGSPSTAAAPAARAVPTLGVRPIITGLDHPWDVRQLPHHRLIFTQRDRRSITVWHRGHSRSVAFDNSRIWVSGETGLLGLEVDPHFGTNRRIYTCQGWLLPGGGHDVRVVAWKLSRHLRHARLARTLLTGLPSTSGRHGGCRLLITRNGALNVGTGDAATGTNPENLASLGGKTLRLDRFTGRPWRTNPWRHATVRATRYVTSYGHRNVQGLAQRSDGTLWSIEQGTYRDDEVNRIVKGGDYGYNPVPGYNETVPMTDQSLPGTQIDAAWSSGPATIATSGGTFVPRTGWGGLDGALAVAALKGEQLRFLTFDAAGRLVGQTAPDALRHFGRLRTAVAMRNGDLLVPTDNGNGQDVILRVHPVG